MTAPTFVAIVYWLWLGIIAVLLSCLALWRWQDARRRAAYRRANPGPSKVVALRSYPDPYPSHGGAGPLGQTVELDIARLEAKIVLAPVPRGVVLAALLAILLTGCLPAKPIPAGLQAVDAQCDSQCYQPCDTAIPPWTPADPDAPEAWDSLIADVVIPAGELAQRCEAHRAACTRCLDRLRRAGVIR